MELYTDYLFSREPNLFRRSIQLRHSAPCSSADQATCIEIEGFA